MSFERSSIPTFSSAYVTTVTCIYLGMGMRYVCRCSFVFLCPHLPRPLTTRDPLATVHIVIQWCVTLAAKYFFWKDRCRLVEENVIFLVVTAANWIFSFAFCSYSWIDRLLHARRSIRHVKVFFLFSIPSSISTSSRFLFIPPSVVLIHRTYCCCWRDSRSLKSSCSTPKITHMSIPEYSYSSDLPWNYWD